MYYWTAGMSEGNSSPVTNSNTFVETVRSSAVQKGAESNRPASETTHATLNPAQPSHPPIYGASHASAVQPDAIPASYMGRPDFPEVDNFFGTIDTRAVSQAATMPPSTMPLMTYEDNLATLSTAQGLYGTGTPKGNPYYHSSATDIYRTGNMFSASSTTPLLSHHYSVTPTR